MLRHERPQQERQRWERPQPLRRDADIGMRDGKVSGEHPAYLLLAVLEDLKPERKLEAYATSIGRRC